MHADADRERPFVFLANGNLNGRVIRLVADEVHRTQRQRVSVISTTALSPLNVWPDERARPHMIDADIVDLAEAERRVTHAAAFVLPTSFGDAAWHLTTVARRAGTPVVCLVADLNYGASKFDGRNSDHLPDLICVAEPITRAELIRSGIAPSLIRNVGSPYFDTILAAPPLPPPPPRPWRIGILANPNGLRERLSDRQCHPDGVLSAVHRVLNRYPSARITVRLHPRQDRARIAETFPLPSSAAFDTVTPRRTLREFLVDHHLVVGSYSQGLLEARAIGRPAVSFQPTSVDEGQRREIFAAWDVPVVSDEDALADTIDGRLQHDTAPLALRRLVYEPGRSLEAITNAIFHARARTSPPPYPDAVTATHAW